MTFVNDDYNIFEGDDSVPQLCSQEFKEEACRSCFYLSEVQVGHPGGSSVHSVTKSWCCLGYWEDDF